MNRTVYTIGHSTHPLETFLRLLETHAITTVMTAFFFVSF